MQSQNSTTFFSSGSKLLSLCQKTDALVIVIDRDKMLNYLKEN